VLTTNGKFTWTTSGTQFSYLRFYHTIIETVSGWSQAEQAQLIGWWNGYIFSQFFRQSILFPHALDPTAECCLAYEEPLIRLPSWMVPGPTLRLHSCDSNSEVVPRLGKVPYFFFHHTVQVILVSYGLSLLYYTTVYECYCFIIIIICLPSCLPLMVVFPMV